MNEIIKELLNGAPLSNYPQSEHQKFLMPLALAKKEAHLENRVDDEEKIDKFFKRGFSRTSFYVKIKINRRK